MTEYRLEVVLKKNDAVIFTREVSHESDIKIAGSSIILATDLVAKEIISLVKQDAGVP